MRFFALLFILLTFAPAIADPGPIAGAADHWDKLQRMVRVGIITPEAASREKITNTVSKSANARKAAQRGIASINPELHPHKVQRLKAPTIEVELE